MASTEEKHSGVPADVKIEEVPRVDALVIGGGFSGCLLLHKLRDELNLNVKLFEAGSALGGVWYWNRYPGARVDSNVPGYELVSPAVWEKWRWQESFPSQPELLAYFEHVDKTLSLSKDCVFNARVTSAEFLQDVKEWLVRTEDNRVVRTKYLVPAVGTSSKQYIPDWKGLDEFQGTVCHTSNWPREGIDVRGKRVAVIGTGSSGIQVIQEWAKEAAETFVFQRTPNISLPMRQEKLDPAEQEKIDERLAEFKASVGTFGGLTYDLIPEPTFDHPPEEREALYESLYKDGGLKLFVGNYSDLMVSDEANNEVYRFWAKKTRARINDPRLQDLLAPLEQPYPFGSKRSSLEVDYFEQFNKPNVHLVDVNESPIIELKPNGIVTEKGFHEVDAIAVATGYDSATGGLEKLGIKDTSGVNFMQRWKRDGIHTFLGLTTSGCPNMFLPYSVQSPSAFSNGPVTIEVQAAFITDVIRKMEADGIQAIEVKPEAEQGWTAEVHAIVGMTVLRKAKSWYNGSNIPGKRIEMLFYVGGIPRYQQMCQAALERNLEDFNQL